MADKAARFWSKVDKSNPGCWPWTAYVDPSGYGRFRVDGRSAGAHRVAWELTNGPIPEGLILDHTCRNRRCCNPDHLHAVTVRQNAENTSAHRDSATGVRGVYRNPRPGRRKRYEVKVRSGGQTYYGGIHATVEEAETAAIALRSRVMTNNLPDRATERTP